MAALVTESAPTNSINDNIEVVQQSTDNVVSSEQCVDDFKSLGVECVPYYNNVSTTDDAEEYTKTAVNHDSSSVRDNHCYPAESITENAPLIIKGRGDSSPDESGSDSPLIARASGSGRRTGDLENGTQSSSSLVAYSSASGDGGSSVWSEDDGMGSNERGFPRYGLLDSGAESGMSSPGGTPVPLSTVVGRGEVPLSLDDNQDPVTDTGMKNTEPHISEEPLSTVIDKPLESLAFIDHLESVITSHDLSTTLVEDQTENCVLSEQDTTVCDTHVQQLIQDTCVSTSIDDNFISDKQELGDMREGEKEGIDEVGETLGEGEGEEAGEVNGAGNGENVEEVTEGEGEEENVVGEVNGAGKGEEEVTDGEGEEENVVREVGGRDEVREVGVGEDDEREEGEGEGQDGDTREEMEERVELREEGDETREENYNGRQNIIEDESTFQDLEHTPPTVDPPQKIEQDEPEMNSVQEREETRIDTTSPQEQQTIGSPPDQQDELHVNLDQTIGDSQDRETAPDHTPTNVPLINTPSMQSMETSLTMWNGFEGRRISSMMEDNDIDDPMLESNLDSSNLDSGVRRPPPPSSNMPVLQPLSPAPDLNEQYEYLRRTLSHSRSRYSTRRRRPRRRDRGEQVQRYGSTAGAEQQTMRDMLSGRDQGTGELLTLCDVLYFSS